MYRAIGLYALRAGKDPKDNDAVNALLPQIDVYKRQAHGRCAACSGAAAGQSHAGGKLYHSGAGVGAGASLSVLISFLMVLPVLYGAVRTGIQSADPQRCV